MDTYIEGKLCMDTYIEGKLCMVIKLEVLIFFRGGKC
jgi:hypothetical protein